MSAFTDMANTHGKLRKSRIQDQSTESLDEAQAALDDAKMRYDNHPSNRNAHRVARARDRVAAAQRRPNALVMAWGEARAYSMEMDRNGSEDAAYQAEQAAIQAWETVEAQRAACRVVEQVEALTPAVIPALAEWAKTDSGKEYMDLPPDADLVQELRTARMI